MSSAAALAIDRFAKSAHFVQGMLHGAHIGHHHTFRRHGGHQGLDLFSVVLLTVRHDQIGFKTQHSVELDCLGAADAGKRAKGGLGPNAEFGLAHHVDVEVVQEFRPAGHK